MRNFPSHPFYFWSCHTLVIQNLTRIFRLLNRIQILHLLLDHQDYPMAPTHPKRLFIKGLWCYNHNYFHYMYLPPLITLYYQINQKPTTTTKKHRNLPPLPNTTNLPMHTHLDLDYIKTPEKISLTQTHTHTHELKHTHTYLWTFFSAPSSVRKKINYEKFTKIAWTKKLSLIPDSAKTFSLTRHALTPPSTDPQLLHLKPLTLNPTSARPKLLPYNGICFNVPVFTYIYLVKRVKPKSAAIHSWLHNKSHSHLEI